MTKDVLITISGLQMTQESEQDKTEIVTIGNYYKKQDAHYIMYEEVEEGTGEVTKNVIKLKNNQMDVTKRGNSSVHMIFEENRKNNTYYYTSFGSLLVGIDAKKVSILEEEQNIDVRVDYGLEVNHEHLADCSIHVNVKSKEDRSFCLTS